MYKSVNALSSKCNANMGILDCCLLFAAVIVALCNSTQRVKQDLNLQH